MAQIDVNSRFIECRKKWFSIITRLRGHTDKFVLISLCVNFGRNNLRLGSDAALATVSLLCIGTIEHYDHFLDLWVSDHLFHKLYRVVTLFEVPLIDSHIYAILSKLTREVQNPCLVFV